MVALMRGFRIYDHTEKVGEAGGGDSAATHLKHRVRRRRATWTAAPLCRVTRLDRAATIVVAHQGVWHARGNRATEAVSRMQSCVATDSARLLRPRLGEGRNAMLRRGWCVSPVPVAVHDRFGSSVRIEEQKEKD
ncbi:MAG: hypothetical protein JNL29_04710 [Nitrospira sp.]|nr:hypothetical protein [Nitrospira sp.]